MIKSITSNEAKTLLNNNEAILVDVREPAEYAAEHIAGAISVPLSTLSPDTMPKSDKKVIFQCQGGNRSQRACDKIAELGTHDAYSLEGGIKAWKAAGNPVNMSGKFFLPLDRQVQLIIGISVLTGSILAYSVSPAFLLLTGFFGVGLTFAGLTGFCGLAMLLARTPWNKANTGATSCCAVR